MAVARTDIAEPGGVVAGPIAPARIQLSRRKGWRMPPNTVKVTRPGPWGNPFVISDMITPGKKVGGFYIAVPTAEDAVECFRLMLHDPNRADQLAAVSDLRGKNLACWCKPDAPCHADVLLEMANADQVKP